MLPFALFWGIIECLLFKTTLAINKSNNILFLSIFLMVFDLMPLWIYLLGIIIKIMQYKKIYYIVTDRAIYTSKGILNKVFKFKPFAELSHINLHRGIMNQIFNVGDIIATTNQASSSINYDIITIDSVSNYVEIYNLVKKIQEDVYIDVMYPNDKRPKENNGYNTEYKG